MSKIKLVIAYVFLGTLLHAQINYDISSSFRNTILPSIAGSQSQYDIWRDRNRKPASDLLNNNSRDGIVNQLSSLLKVTRTLATGSIPVPDLGSFKVTENTVSLDIHGGKIEATAKGNGISVDVNGIIVNRTEDIVIKEMQKVQSTTWVNRNQCIKIFGNAVLKYSFSNVRYNSTTNILTFYENGTRLQFNFNDYGIKSDEVRDFVRYLKLQQIQSPDITKYIFVSTFCSPFSRTINEKPFELDAPHSLVKGLVDEDLVLTSIATGVDYDDSRTSRIDRPIAVRPMDIIVNGLNNPNKAQKIFNRFDIYDILLDIVGGLNTYGISLELTAGSLTGLDGKVEADVKFTFKPGRRKTEYEILYYSEQNTPTPYGEIVNAICAQLNSGNNLDLIRKNFPTVYKAGILMTVLSNIYDKTVMLDTIDYEKYIKENYNRQDIFIDQHRFRDEVLSPEKSQNAQLIRDCIMYNDILPDNKLLSLFMQYVYCLEQRDSIRSLFPHMKSRDDPYRDINIEVITKIIDVTEDNMYKIVYGSSENHIVSTDKIDFYIPNGGPSLVYFLKNLCHEYYPGGGVEFPSEMGNIFLYANSLNDSYSGINDLKKKPQAEYQKSLEENEDIRAFFSVPYSLDDYIQDVLWHEYAHSLDTYLYLSNDYFYRETEARAFLLAIHMSENPYYTMSFVKGNYSETTDDDVHKLGALIALFLLRSFSNDDKFEETYITAKYSADRLREIAGMAYEYTHAIYNVDIDKNSKIPILPIYIDKDGERYWADTAMPAKHFYFEETQGAGPYLYTELNHAYIVPGQLFNSVLLPYILNNSNEKDWYSIIGSLNIWPPELLTNLKTIEK
jgi:hypothetical protein